MFINIASRIVSNNLKADFIASKANNISNVAQGPTLARSTVVPQVVIPTLDATMFQLQAPMVVPINHAERPENGLKTSLK